MILWNNPKQPAINGIVWFYFWKQNRQYEMTFNAFFLCYGFTNLFLNPITLQRSFTYYKNKKSTRIDRVLDHIF